MKNLEIKGKIENREEFQHLVEDSGAKYVETISQEDVYFHSKSGKLKLRIFSSSSSELIYYDRNEEQGKQRWSFWDAYPLDDPRKLEKILSKSLGVRAVVIKERALYTYKNARIHLDRVKNLGEYFEIESRVVDTEKQAAQTLEELIEKLEIYADNLMNCSYVDLIEKQEEQQ